MKTFIPALAVLAMSLGASAEPVQTEVSGSARVRTEFRNNTESSDLTGSRIRAEFKIKANEKTHLFLQPQFTKLWGEPEGAASTSGAVHDTEIDLHQGYLTYLIDETFSFRLGRSELNYGDQLLVGGVGWSHTGRSFDLALARFQKSHGSVEIFNSKLVDRNLTTAGPGDRNFSGIYSSYELGSWAKAFDLYAFLLEDRGADPALKTAAYGTRLKSEWNGFDLRLEATFETVEAGSQQDEHQVDIEIGHRWSNASIQPRLSAEYFQASEDFDQLFPTGHKWLGIADLFTRKNIKGYRLGLSSLPVENLSVALDYHFFQRESADADVASEFDLVLGRKFKGDLSVEAGAAYVLPASDLKAAGFSDPSTFFYFQVATHF